MTDLKGITQGGMADLGRVRNSTIYKIITRKQIVPLPSVLKNKFRYTIQDTRAVLRDCLSEKFNIEKKVQCFYNFKGGVGKTSICFQVASHLALMGFNVLVIDADPQGHLSTSLGINSGEKYYTLHDAISGTQKITEIIQNIYEGLDCIPANLSLTRVEVTLNEMPKREERVRMLIEEIKDQYDFVLFDTNPTISYLNRNIITCSDLINIIVETQAYSLNGIKLVLGDMESFASSMMMKMPTILMLPNKYEDRTATSAEAMTLLNKYYSEYLKPNWAIRKSEDFNIAAKLSQPLAFFCKRNSIAFADVIDAIYFILEKSCSKTGE